MGPFDYKSTLIILHGLPRVCTCFVVLFTAHLHDLKFYTTSANPTLLCACSQSRGAWLGWDVETEGHTLTVSSIILQEFINIGTVCSHHVIIFLKPICISYAHPCSSVSCLFLLPLPRQSPTINKVNRVSSGIS